MAPEKAANSARKAPLASTFQVSLNTFASATGIGIVGALTGISIVSQGGAEVRVKTIALMPAIYY